MRILVIAILLATPTTVSLAQQTPTFEQYPAKVVPIDRRVTVRIRSTPYTLCFRTMLRRTVRSGDQFAGHYLIGQCGCGSECVRLGIVDMRTGRAYVSPFIVHMYGIRWRADSRLLVVNDPNDIVRDFGTGPLPERFRPEYYFWDGRNLRPIENGKLQDEPEPMFKKCADF